MVTDPRDERGTTLVELLTVIMILSTVSLVLAQAMIVGFKTLDVAAARTEAASDADRLSAHFRADVHGADDVRLDPAGCGADVVAMVTFAQPDGRVTYGLRQANGEEHLVRTVCAGPDVEAVQTIAWGLDPLDDADVVVNVECPSSPTGCPAPEDPEMVTITVDDGHGHNYDVTGTRRVRP